MSYAAVCPVRASLVAGGGIPRALWTGAASPASWLWVLGGGGANDCFAV